MRCDGGGCERSDGELAGGDKFGGINSACFYSVSLKAPKLNKVENIIPPNPSEYQTTLLRTHAHMYIPLHGVPHSELCTISGSEMQNSLVNYCGVLCEPVVSWTFSVGL